MEPRELAEFQDIYQKIRPNDTIKLREWFLSYPELTGPELCQIMRCSEGWISKLRQRCGAYPVILVEGVPPSKVERPSINHDWDDDWIIDQYVNNGAGIRGLSIKINRSRDVVRTVLRRHGILVPRSPNNPCRNKTWLEEHYINQRLSTRQCGQLAGVGHRAIRMWCICLGIPLRDRYEACKYGSFLGKTPNKYSFKPSVSRTDPHTFK